jgi:23S rRNA G2445 N2-methylase RlmL
VVAAEVTRRLGLAARAVPGRDDSLWIEYAGPWRRLADLRTVVAVFAVLTFPVPRPRSLSSGEYFPAIVDTVRRVSGAASFRFEAAGADSAVFRRLADQLAEATGLRFDPGHGDVVLRFRRTPGGSGWDVLVRLTPRPLSDRPWRVAHLPGAVNATVAAAVVALARPRPDDRVVNLMCGSGTLLIERLLAAPARVAVAVDRDPRAVAAAEANLRAAGVRERVRLLRADIAAADWFAAGPYDLLLADPPWGTLVGDHATNETLYARLLARARQAAAPGARFAVLTHEIRLMERCLARASTGWRVESVTRVFQKGHHPRIYLLRP